MFSKNRSVRVGTRKSPLAIKQTMIVINQLKMKVPQLSFELIEIGTKGDRDKKTPLNQFRQDGIFTNEVEQAILDGQIDFAVHSYKDMPIQLAEGLVVASVPERENPFDCLILRKATTLADLPSGALIGTSSLRREVELLRLRSDLNTAMLRGNIDQRLEQLAKGEFEGIILANAGLNRLGWLNKEKFSVISYTEKEFMPSVGQGALALECRREDQFTVALLSKINHQPTAYSVRAERRFLQVMASHEEKAVGAYGVFNTAHAGILNVMRHQTVRGLNYQRHQFIGSNPEKLGQMAANELLGKATGEGCHL